MRLLQAPGLSTVERVGDEAALTGRPAGGVADAGDGEEVEASDGALLGTFNAHIPVGVAFDGANIWVTNEGSNTVSKL